MSLYTSTRKVNRACRENAVTSVDHRISDGAEAAQFVQALAKYLEEPVRLLI